MVVPNLRDRGSDKEDRTVATRKYNYYRIGKKAHVAVDWSGLVVVAIGLPIVLIGAVGLSRLVIWIVESLQRLG